MPFISNCRICDSKDLEEFLNLGHQPWCNDFALEENVGHETKYPLSMCFCHHCSTPQLNFTVPKEVMYCKHDFLSGQTKTMVSHFSKVSENSLKILNKKGKVLDIGSNDGTFLDYYKKRGCEVLGVDPCHQVSKLSVEKGIDTMVEFFDYDLSKKIENKYGKFNIISAANVFYHLENLHSVAKGIKNLLDRDGIFIIQSSYFPSIMYKNAFDVIYHEHLLQYRLGNLQYLLSMYDMEIFHIEMSDVHGGSMISYACHNGKREKDESVKEIEYQEECNHFSNIETYLSFSKRVGKLKTDINTFISSICKSGKSVYAFGVPAKGTVLLNYCGIDSSLIPFAVDLNTFKIGKFIPCTGIKICDERTVAEPDYYLLLSWNFLDEFKQSYKYLSGQRKFIVPIPEVRIESNAR